MSDAILALWNDYPVDMAEEYETWHTFEHVPERLTVPGMRAARRYISSVSRETYFTLYELEDPTVIEHPAYLDLVRNPTPWSQKMRQHFANVLRIPGETVITAGHGIGAAAIALAYSVDRDKAREAALLIELALRKLITEARILGFQIALAEPNQIYEVFAQDETTDPDTMNIVVIIEGGSTDALATVHDATAQRIEELVEPRLCLRNDLFNLLISYRAEEFPSDRSKITAGQTKALIR